MNSWLSKKKAPDGTEIIRHDQVETQLGVTPGTEGFTRTREVVYARLFDKILNVSHELLPLIPHSAGQTSAPAGGPRFSHPMAVSWPFRTRETIFRTE
jgi:hypothetical protein